MGGWAAKQTASGVIGAGLSLVGGALFGASIVVVVDGATDIEAGLFGASIALLAVSFTNAVTELGVEETETFPDRTELLADAASKAALQLGEQLAERGDRAAARDAYKIAIERGHAEVVSRAAVLLAQQGDLAAAMAALEQAAALGHGDVADAARSKLEDMAGET